MYTFMRRERATVALSNDLSPIQRKIITCINDLLLSTFTSEYYLVKF